MAAINHTLCLFAHIRLEFDQYFSGPPCSLSKDQRRLGKKPEETTQKDDKATRHQLDLITHMRFLSLATEAESAIASRIETILTSTALGITPLSYKAKGASKSLRQQSTRRFFVAARHALPALVTVFNTASEHAKTSTKCHQTKMMSLHQIIFNVHQS
ncbi:hypothetical protein C2W62_14505 [Candidatus Entotheonella serta]|nr:hypothetical protein C2W62_14505 [Candidatus Entotheonella serta]